MSNELATPKRAVKKAVKKTAKVMVHPYLPMDLRKRFKTYAVQKGTSESAIAETAIAEYLDGTSDKVLLMKRLNKQTRQLNRLQRDLDAFSEAFGVFVRTWLAHTPALPEAEKKMARRHALLRFKEFTEHTADLVGSGNRFIDDLTREQLGAEDELRSAVANPPTDVEPSSEEAAP